MLSDNVVSLANYHPTQLTPSDVLILHRSKAYGIGEVKAVTHHPLVDGVIQQGVAIDKARLIESIGQDGDMSVELLEPTTLMDNARGSVWYRPSQKRVMHFANNSVRSNFSVIFPATLFIFIKRSRSLYLFALGDDKRPTPESMLYRLPIGNVNEQGHLCQGSGSSYIPETVTQQNFDLVERCFFDSISGHTSTDFLFKRDKKAEKKTQFTHLIRYWKTLGKQNKKPSVKRDMIALETLETTAKRIFANG